MVPIPFRLRDAKTVTDQVQRNHARGDYWKHDILDPI